AKPFVAGDPATNLGNDAAIPHRKPIEEGLPLIAQRDERVDVFDRGEPHAARSSEKARRDPRNVVEPQKTQLADINRLERDPSHNLLRQQNSRRMPQFGEAGQGHARSSPPKTTGGLCKYRAACRFASIT